eukprot:5725-Heterococcus_DN1.PRE.2
MATVMTYTQKRTNSTAAALQLIPVQLESWQQHSTRYCSRQTAMHTAAHPCLRGIIASVYITTNRSYSNHCCTSRQENSSSYAATMARSLLRLLQLTNANMCSVSNFLDLAFEGSPASQLHVGHLYTSCKDAQNKQQDLSMLSADR